MTELYVTSNLKEEDSAGAMEAAPTRALTKLPRQRSTSMIFFGKEDSGVEEDEDEDEDFVDYTDEFTGEWNGPTRVVEGQNRRDMETGMSWEGAQIFDSMHKSLYHN